MKKEDKIQNNKLALSINSSSVVDTLDLLRQELQKIEEVTTNAYKTNGTIDNININIQSETKKDNLIKMFSILLSKKEYYDKAQAKLEISTAPVFTEKGFTIEDYESDIKLRIRIIESDSRKKELESLINEAQSEVKKKFRIGAVSGMLKCCSCGYEYEELIIAKDDNMKCKDCAF